MRNASRSDRSRRGPSRSGPSPADPSRAATRPPGLVPRRGLAALALTSGGLALLFSFRTPAADRLGGLTASVGDPAAGDPAPVVPIATDAAPVATTDAPATPGRTSRDSSAASDPTPRPATTQRRITGQMVDTPYGLVQVRVTLAGKRITDVQAVQLPYDHPHSARISQVVEPMLHDEALQAQSANIDLISGATYTSEGYAMSLQSALDQAG